MEQINKMNRDSLQVELKEKKYQLKSISPKLAVYLTLKKEIEVIEYKLFGPKENHDKK